VNSIARYFMNLSCLLGIIGCATPAPPAGAQARRQLAEQVRKDPELAVLFVGNSYSFGVPKAFSKCAASHGKKVRTGHVTSGGWTLERHSKNEPTLRKIREGCWDVVVIQEQSLIPALPPRERAATMFPPLRQLVAAARESGAVPMLYQTWGRRDGDAEVPGDDFLAMNQRLREGYRAAAIDAGESLVAPVGDAWENEVRAGRGEALFMEDGSHPTPHGDQLTAATFYEAIYGGAAGD
jgi:hypothetical protein